MKVFWAILLGSFMIASAIVFTSDSRGQRDAEAVAAPQSQNPSSKEDFSGPSTSSVSSESEPGRTVASENVLESVPPRGQEEIAEDFVVLNLDELLGIEQEPNQVTPEMAIADIAIEVEGGRSLSQMKTAEFAELALQAQGSAEEASRVAGSISPSDEVREDDGALVIGRVRILGSGSEADPYELPWGVLISAIRTYNPRLELNDLPAWSEALNGKHVRLTGFAFLPVVASQTDELLLMLNPWDGCHMGAPPTPYDSVEVMLNEAVNLGGRNGFVTVTGIFNVDPYLLRGWLVSLYTMEQARLEFSGS